MSKPSTPIYVVPNDDACLRIFSGRPGQVHIHDEPLDGQSCFGVIEIDEQAGVDALFRALAGYVSDEVRRSVGA
jgi:hypothetical protein